MGVKLFSYVNTFVGFTQFVVAEELFSINMNIVIVMFHFRSADFLFTCGQRIRT